MSRIIVKNLPNNVTLEKLKKKFSEKGKVTDAQLKYTPDGKFRKFGFVGFQTEEEAQAAINYFNNTFYNTSRIRVELCAELGASTKPRAWSKYACDSSAYEKINTKEQVDVESEEKVLKKKKSKKVINEELVDKLKELKNNPDFIEFLEVHGENANPLLLATEDSGVGGSDEEREAEESEKEEKSIAHAPISDTEYLNRKTKSKHSSGESSEVLEETVKSESLQKDVKSKSKDKGPEKKIFFTIKITNMPFKTKKKDIKALLKPLSPASIRVVRTLKGIAYVGFKTEKEMRQALIKNKTFISGKQIFIKEHKQNQVDEEPSKWREQKESLQNEESIAESGRLFVRNLSYTITEKELEDLFSKYGPVTEVIGPIDRLTRQVKGFGVVTFLMPEHAVAAYTALDGSILHGRMLHLLPGKPKEEETDESLGGGSYKAKKQEKLKKTAQSSHSWNTLFLGQDAVAEVIAEKYNASKQEVLTGSDAPVRLALGETQIVAETKQFLEENGVILDAFNQEVKQRSKTTILVKNLPAKTTSSEIRELFAKYGELGRIVLPPSGVTGIVEFLEPSEARSAFMKLAYTKFKHLPLYLEWAPENTFTSKKIEKQEEVKENDTNAGDTDTIDINKRTNEDEEEDLEPEPETTLFVKNLNFQTTEETLKQFFSKCGKIASATVARKKDPSKPGQHLSMGYGFVQFYFKSSMNEALKTLQGSMLEGHAVELKRSNRTLESDVNTRKITNLQKQTGTKILVRNIPFQATAKEISTLFKTFGELKSVRLPKKMVGTGPHRGFGFVEFVTKHDAKKAMKALCQSTHFFGRRLVLEWAETEDNVADLRKRTAQQFIQDISTTKKSKKATANIEIDEGEEEGERWRN